MPFCLLLLVGAACVWVGKSTAQEETKLPAVPELPLPIMEPEEPKLPKISAKPTAEDPTGKKLESQAQMLESGLKSGNSKDLLAVVADLEVRQAVLGRELAKSKSEEERLREENDRLKLQMQALGVAALSGDERSLQLRLINALNDYRVADEKRQALTEKLVQLFDAVSAWQLSSDVSSRRRLDEAIAEASGVLKGSTPAEETPPTPMEQARVVSLKRDMGLIVTNCGKSSGMRMGQTLAFVRKERTIAQGVIVDCRDGTCGTLLTSTPTTTDGVTLGDTIKLVTTENTK